MREFRVGMLEGLRFVKWGYVANIVAEESREGISPHLKGEIVRSRPAQDQPATQGEVCWSYQIERSSDHRVRELPPYFLESLFFN